MSEHTRPPRRYRLRRTLSTVLAAGGLLVGLVAAAAPAQAQESFVHDGLDTHARAELTGVKLINGPQRVVVVLVYNDISYLRGAEYPFGIFYDTDPGRHGPEYLLPSHFGSVYGTEDRRHWNADFDKEKRCFTDGTIHWHTNTLRLVAGRRCFDGDTDSIRVSVDVAEKNPRRQPHRPFIIDWAPGERRFGPWTRGS
jgi:hypothetical protein